MSKELFLDLIKRCFTPNILVFRLSVMLLFIKKLTQNHTRISQSLAQFHLRELSWTILLKASSEFYTPDIPVLAETLNVNGVPTLVNRLKNANITLQISLLHPILSNFKCSTRLRLFFCDKIFLYKISP